MIAVLIIAMRMVDLLWMLGPAFHHRKWIVMDVVALIGFGGLWLWLFTWQLGKRSLIPINDPQCGGHIQPGSRLLKLLMERACGLRLEIV